MTFLAPWALWFSAVIPVIVMLYLLKLKRRTVQVSTLMFWQRMLQENRRRALFQKLRQWLSLLLHLLIFLLILLALAKPDFNRLAGTGTSTVFIIDGRARMQAVEKDGMTRFEKARRQLSAYASRASDQNKMALLMEGGHPRVMIPFTGNEKAFQGPVATMQAGDTGGDMEDAVRLAKELLASRPGKKRIVVLTDSLFNAETGVETIAVGHPLENVAITQFAARPLPGNSQTSEVFLKVKNFGREPVSTDVEIYSDGTLLDVKHFQIGSHETASSIFPMIPPAGSISRGWLTARIEKPDALAVDNEAYAVLPANTPVRVLLISKGNWFLEKMLASHDRLKFDLLDPESFQSGMAENFDVLIFDGTLPAGLELQTLKGNCLFINANPLGENPQPSDQPIITDTDGASPLMRAVNLKNVTFLRGMKIPFSESMGSWHFTAPLRSFENPLVITGSRTDHGKDQRLAIFAFDIADSDLPLRIAFPLLMSNTLEWLANDDAATGTHFKAGDLINLKPGETLWKTPLRKFGDPGKIDSSQLATNFYQPNKNGFYLLQNGNRQEWAAVNTFSEAESNLDKIAQVSPENPHLVPPSSLVMLAARPLWHYLLLAAFFLFTLEWCLYHHRRTE